MLHPFASVAKEWEERLREKSMHCSHLSRSNLRVRGRTESCPIDGPPPAIIRTCTHILDSGVFCHAPARHGRRYCRHHVELGIRRWRMARARRRMRLRIPPLDDMIAVQLARARVRYGLAAGRISPADARLFFFALRMAADNLRFLEQQECWCEEELELSRLGVPNGP